MIPGPASSASSAPPLQQSTQLPSQQRVLLPKDERKSSPTAAPRVPESGPAKKRKCISLACMPCRTRKSKCDGNKPACSACRTVYSTECVYDIDSDRRRKGALKRDIKHLMEDNERRDVILEALRNASDADLDDVVRLIRSDRTYEQISDALESLNLNLTLRNQTNVRPTLEGELANFAGKPVTDKAGQTMHYGHTSNLSFIRQVEVPSSKAPGKTVTWTNVTTDMEFINHLFELYFAWSHPFYPLFPQDSFMLGMRERIETYCTPILVNAILAAGCHFSDRPEARADPNDPSTVGDHFFAEAKRILCEDILHEVENTALTTVQALGLMSLKAAMAGHDSPGWKYAGQMMTRLVELGLHTSMHTASVRRFSPMEIEARKVTFWGCYVLHTAWAICIGRISLIPSAAITQEKPQPRAELEMKAWTPFGCAQQDQLTQPGFTYTVLRECGTLTEIVNETVHMFYAPQDRTTSRKVLNLYVRMQNWYSALPESMAIQPEGRPTTAQVLAMHIYYHNCVLHLFRPFLRVTFVQAAKPPQVACMESARAITQLIAVYERLYSLRRVCLIITHCAMTAGIQHLVNMQSTKPEIAEQAGIDLAATITAIATMAQRSPMSDRFIKILMDLIRRWAVKVPEIVQSAMADAENGSANKQDRRSTIGEPSPALGKTSPLPTRPIYPQNTDSKPSSVRPPENKNNTPGPHQQNPPNPFWTPFPGSFEGSLVTHTTSENCPKQQRMDITSVLDSGVAGDWAQLNRDGFTMENAGVGLDPNLWKSSEQQDT